MRESAGEFPAAPYLYFTVFSGFGSCCLNKKFRIFNVCLLSESLFKMRDSAVEFPAAPYLYFTVFSWIVSCCDLRALSYGFQRFCFLLCLNKRLRIFNIWLMSKSSFKMRDSAGEFPAAPYLYFTVFSGFGSCCLNKKFRIFNVWLLSKSLFKMRDSAVEFPAPPYLYFTGFSGFGSCCLNKKFRIFNVRALSKSLFKMRDSAGEFLAAA